MRSPILRSNRPATDSRDYRKPGSSERLFGRNNELNANDKRDGLVQLKALLDGITAGDTTLDDTDQELTAAETHEVLRVAYEKADVQAPEWKRMGVMLAQEVYQYSQRQGFFRNFLDRQEVADGSKPEITVVENHVTAIVSTSPTQLQPQYIYDDATFNPPEFEIKAHVRVFEKDMKSSNVDLLDRRYNEALEVIMVVEDRQFINMLDEMAGTELPIMRFGNSLTPANITYMRQTMEDAGVTPVNVLMNSSYASDFIVNTDFQGVYDPVTQREILQTGKIMTGLYGLNWWTDATRKRPNLRVLARNAFYMMAEPAILGSYTDRGPLQAIPVDGYPQGELSRGWLIHEQLSMALTNPQALIKGTK